MEHLTIKQAAKELKFHHSTVRKHLLEWKFFQMPGSRVWRVRRSDLERVKEIMNNPDRLALSVEEVKLCRSTKEEKYTGLLSLPRVAKELDVLLAQK